MANPDIALLVFSPLKQRRKDNSFDGNDNVGALVVKDILERAGHEVGFCSPQTAAKHKVVLVSFTSSYDAYAYYKQVGLLDIWQPEKRSFVVIGGGAGMQNPYTVRHFLDYAVFGRAEGVVTPLVEHVLGGNNGPFAHPSVMALPDISPVVINQAPSLYPHKVGFFEEGATGCPLKCKFCHFTYARKQQGHGDTYVQAQVLANTKMSVELTWDQLFTWEEKAGKFRVGLDGSSERIRYIYGKRISDYDVKAGIEALGRFEGITTLDIYNIGNFPHEQPEDFLELESVFRTINPKNKVVAVVHTTPFRPSPATPMQWEGYSLLPDWSKRAGGIIVDRPTVAAYNSRYMESPWSHFMSAVVERGHENSDVLFRLIATSPKLNGLKVANKLLAVKKAFDIDPYLREYDIDEDSPTWFLDSYVPMAAMRKMAHKMREQMQYAIANPGWLPGSKSLVELRMAKLAREGKDFGEVHYAPEGTKSKA